MAKQGEGPSEGESSQGSAPLEGGIADGTTPHGEVREKKKNGKLKNGKGKHPSGGRRNGVERSESLKGVKKSGAKGGRKRKVMKQLKRKGQVKERGGSGSEEDSEVSEGGSSEGSGEDLLEVDFEMIDPSDKYKDNVRILLRSTELYPNLKCTEELVSIICDQQNIGKFLCVASGQRVGEKEGASENVAAGGEADLSSGDGNNVVGFLTIINLNQYAEIAALKELLLQKVKKVNAPDYVESAKRITSLLLTSETKNVGLLLGHRILNTPISLVPLIHKNVIEDVYWSQGIEDLDESEKKFYFFDFLLIYTKVYHTAEGELIFANYEEEHFFQHKTDHVMWNNNNVKKFYEAVEQKNREVTYKEFATVFVVPFGQVGAALKQMESGVSGVSGVSSVSGGG
ncbi:protein BCP1, putative [Plasmodium vivax]|uniref:Protein BCP1 n=5 Tax=Plasmodium vivax TaxID=5855 RepID=A5K2Z8_PLAVS|nr:hypothetical protein, conserved [Plasmodium vivax]KMZ79071.1 hypothetical protein PVIIG_05191 [Plasmodium vivax India VII]KMZ84981.1 hypothetical protein PVBG_01380 [Plasmodium vivax Brazil I]KMZ97957.1 hypothetical protein PVNG_00295 [Plasmodium vivax North Korean]EDL45902.1 hypothetical protein, conserved [Plasmodium vivax]CAG9473483.1 unnamed protein product [Plasmodium vivax]|eukprot:XP_001615629.1 hypothetical protein [Plasmodium vivax Sal-1]